MPWGDFFGFIGKVGDRLVQGKREALRNKIEKIKRDMDEIIEKGSLSTRDAQRHYELSQQLREAENTLKNI